MKAAVLLYLVSGMAAAATCQRLEYAEVKDWPVEEVERAYCADQKEMYAILNKAARAQAPGLLRYGEECAKSADLYERVLKNVHKRPTPACK